MQKIGFTLIHPYSKAQGEHELWFVFKESIDVCAIHVGSLESYSCQISLSTSWFASKEHPLLSIAVKNTPF